jgi:hypothetical protein
MGMLPNCLQLIGFAIGILGGLFVGIDPEMIKSLCKKQQTQRNIKES